MSVHKDIMDNFVELAYYFVTETTNLCKNECQHGGRCNRLGECECTQGYHGQFCELGRQEYVIDFVYRMISKIIAG